MNRDIADFQGPDHIAPLAVNACIFLAGILAGLVLVIICLACR